MLLFDKDPQGGDKIGHTMYIYIYNIYIYVSSIPHLVIQ